MRWCGCGMPSAAIGLYRGENAERRLLSGRLSEVMANYGYWRNRMVLFTGWNLSVSQAIDPLPFIVQAPRLFARRFRFGDVFQSATAFQTIHNSLSFFRDAYDSFASYRAAIIRLDGLRRGEHARPRVQPGADGVTTDGSLDGQRCRGTHPRRRESASVPLTSASIRVTRC